MDLSNLMGRFDSSSSSWETLQGDVTMVQVAITMKRMTVILPPTEMWGGVRSNTRTGGGAEFGRQAAVIVGLSYR